MTGVGSNGSPDHLTCPDVLIHTGRRGAAKDRRMGINNEADAAGCITGGRRAFNQQRLRAIGQIVSAAECNSGSDGVQDGLGGRTRIGFSTGEGRQQEAIFFTGTQAIGSIKTAAVGSGNRRVQNIIHAKQVTDGRCRVGHLGCAQGGGIVRRATEGLLGLGIGERGQHVNIEHKSTVVSGDNPHTPKLSREVFTRASGFVQVVSGAAAVDKFHNNDAGVTARRHGDRAIGPQSPRANQRFAIGLINLYFQIVTAKRRAADKIKLNSVLDRGFSPTVIVVIATLIMPAMATACRCNPDHAPQPEGTGDIARIRVRLRKVRDRMASHYRAIMQAS